jgi:endonuclease YncB( thermonuclease family)
LPAPKSPISNALACRRAKRVARRAGLAALAALCTSVSAWAETPSAGAAKESAGAAAQDTAAMPRIGSDCGGGTGMSGTATNVVDGRTFVLADGREMRLAAVETPPLASLDRTAEHAGTAAKAALEALVLHRQVVVLPADAAPDRYGRLVVYAFVTFPESFVQHDLLAAGYALLAPIAAKPGCRNLLRVAERAARDAKLGLWSEPYYEIKRADNFGDILAERGRFVLVSGKVFSVRERGGLVYVNFGWRRSEDLTVTIQKRNERLFTAAGIVPKQLAGRRIEVRGWIEERGGPAIEAARPEQIELVEAARKANE